MTPCFKEILQSGQFRFLVGTDRTPFIVHAAAMSATSEQMDRLINGSMKEAGEGCVELPDISIDDFTRICEYAYCGDYTTPPFTVDVARAAGTMVGRPDFPKHTPAGRHSEVVESEQPPQDDLWGTSKETKKKLPKKVAFRSKYSARTYLSHDEYESTTTARFKVVMNSADDQNFAPVFLAHARLYAFACLRMIDGLKALTLQKLHKTLVGFQIFHNRIDDVIALVRYVYSEEVIPGRDHEGKTDAMRDMIVTYVASEFDIIGNTPEFDTLIEEGGEFASDLCRTLRTGLI